MNKYAHLNIFAAVVFAACLIAPDAQAVVEMNKLSRISQQADTTSMVLEFTDTTDLRDHSLTVRVIDKTTGREVVRAMVDTVQTDTLTVALAPVR